jgi:hypothetical protein
LYLDPSKIIFANKGELTMSTFQVHYRHIGVNDPCQSKITYTNRIDAVHAAETISEYKYSPYIAWVVEVVRPEPAPNPYMGGH